LDDGVVERQPLERHFQFRVGGIKHAVLVFIVEQVLGIELIEIGVLDTAVGVVSNECKLGSCRVTLRSADDLGTGDLSCLNDNR
jgi:hypothetical protein